MRLGGLPMSGGNAQRIGVIMKPGDNAGDATAPLGTGRLQTIT